jgi:hypothetical protein
MHPDEQQIVVQLFEWIVVLAKVLQHLALHKIHSMDDEIVCHERLRSQQVKRVEK